MGAEPLPTSDFWWKTQPQQPTPNMVNCCKSLKINGQLSSRFDAHLDLLEQLPGAFAQARKRQESKVSLPQTSRPRANGGICKNEQHPLWKCEKFKGMQVSSRRDYVKENNVCFNCLREGHKVTNWLTTFTCRVCNRRHHSLLHEERADDQAKTKSGSASEGREKKEEPQPRMSACSATSRSNLFDRTILKVVPVKVWASNPSYCVYTHAFIDEGSGVNMCSASLIRQLGIEVKDCDVELWTTNGVSRENKMAAEPMTIKGIAEDSSFEVKDVLIVEDIVDGSWSIPRKELTEGYPHLQEINFPQLVERKWIC